MTVVGGGREEWYVIEMSPQRFHHIIAPPSQETFSEGIATVRRWKMAWSWVGDRASAI